MGKPGRPPLPHRAPRPTRSTCRCCVFDLSSAILPSSYPSFAWKPGGMMAVPGQHCEWRVWCPKRPWAWPSVGNQCSWIPIISIIIYWNICEYNRMSIDDLIYLSRVPNYSCNCNWRISNVCQWKGGGRSIELDFILRFVIDRILGSNSFRKLSAWVQRMAIEEYIVEFTAIVCSHDHIGCDRSCAKVCIGNRFVLERGKVTTGVVDSNSWRVEEPIDLETSVVSR